VQILIMLAIGGAAGAASFTHIHNVAAAHGQDGWLAWADAIVLELMSIASGLEIRRRKRHHAPVTFPGAVLVSAVALSISAQVVEAETSAIGWIAAALPALGFLVMVKIALARTATEQPQTVAATPRPDTSHQTPTVHTRSVPITAHPASSTDSPPSTRRQPRQASGGKNVPLTRSPERRRRDGELTPHRPATADDRPRPTTSGDDHRTNRDATPVTDHRPSPNPETDRVANTATATVPSTGITALLPAGRAARDELNRHGRPLTRDTLADQLRRDGHPIRNARVSVLLALLRTEQPASQDHPPRS
jgi:hypothetical protein